MNSKQFGFSGEQAACEYLQSKGYNIIMRNYHNKLGEIDIVANDNGSYVFVEVKSRKNKSYGRPAASVGQSKQHKLIILAQCFLKYYHLKDVKCRFDVIEVYFQMNEHVQINHIRSAFTA